MIDVLRFWLELGIDGFRVDALSALFEDERLRDNPPNPAWVPAMPDRKRCCNSGIRKSSVALIGMTTRPHNCGWIQSCYPLSLLQVQPHPTERGDHLAAVRQVGEGASLRRDGSTYPRPLLVERR